jgi:hypothetical protein
VLSRRGQVAGIGAGLGWAAACRRRHAVRRQLSLPQADDLYKLITERAGRSIIITSNRAPADWYPLFPNPVVAESILDRLVNAAFHVPMPGRSYRATQRPTATGRSGQRS